MISVFLGCYTEDLRGSVHILEIHTATIFRFEMYTLMNYCVSVYTYTHMCIHVYMYFKNELGGRGTEWGLGSHLGILTVILSFITMVIMIHSIPYEA
jgi:hypothetical protein